MCVCVKIKEETKHPSVGKDQRGRFSSFLSKESYTFVSMFSSPCITTLTISINRLIGRIVKIIAYYFTYFINMLKPATL
jgi:hypothetical protein